MTSHPGGEQRDERRFRLADIAQREKTPLIILYQNLASVLDHLPLAKQLWSYRRGARHRDGHIHMSRIRRAEAQCARVVLICAREELDLDGLGLPGWDTKA